VDDDASASEETFPCPHCGAPIPEIGMAHFSFNKPAGACPTCTGLGSVHQANIKRLVDEQKSIPDGAVAGWDLFHINYYTSTLQPAAAHYRDSLDDFLATQTCPDCAGTRRAHETRVWTLNGQTTIAAPRLPLNDLGAWLGGPPAVLSPDEMIIAEPILVDLSERITRL